MPVMHNGALFWPPLESLEDKAVEQIYWLSQMPFIYKHVAVMPDAHVGRGACIGTCIPTKGAVIPAAVGVDIGCGMIAVKTPFSGDQLRDSDLSELREAIEDQVPLAAGHYNKSVKKTARERVKMLEELASENGRFSFYEQTSPNWRKQLGSLGSGNHFIEIVVDEDDCVWAFLHSGSRGIGNKVAQHHIKLAKKGCKDWHINLADDDLAYFPVGTSEFKAYMTDLNWLQTFARFNRDEMMDRVLNILRHRFGEFEEEERINCHHNFTQWENWDGENILISRKGAIEAQAGQLGLIPGSMGTRSYVVKGKGNKASFNTAPHGAGRRFSRSAARRQFTMEDFDRETAGVEVRRDESFLDEIPSAYKDIDDVMEQSSDLVEIVHEFSALVNVKG